MYGNVNMHHSLPFFMIYNDRCPGYSEACSSWDLLAPRHKNRAKKNNNKKKNFVAK